MSSRRRLHSQLAAADGIETYFSLVMPHYYLNNSAVTEYSVPCLHCPSLVIVDHGFYRCWLDVLWAAEDADFMLVYMYPYSISVAPCSAECFDFITLQLAILICL